jgi:hypothetical protein
VTGALALFVLAGGAAGAAQAGLLARAARGRPGGGPLRLLGAGAVLAAAAWAGHLGGAAVGWGAGFSAGAAALLGRWR